MTMATTFAHEHAGGYSGAAPKRIITGYGFWIFLLSDIVMFSAFFAAYAVLAGDTVPCVTLDELAAGADALVHTVIRKDLIEAIPQQRVRDICDYHSSVEEAAGTAARVGVGTLILTHCVPAVAPGQEGDWRAKAASVFDGRVEIGPDLHRVEVQH